MHVADELLSRYTLIGMPSSRRGALAGVVHAWIDRMVMRNTGSTALHLALLSAGAMDAVYCDDCRLWDVAAGALLATEAGAKLIPLAGDVLFPVDLAHYSNQQMPFLAAGPRTLDELWAEYQRAARV
jgi:fructose-1,6-bisphosphatase/inositol monophosphatase family enzyme